MPIFNKLHDQFCLYLENDNEIADILDQLRSNKSLEKMFKFFWGMQKFHNLFKINKTPSLKSDVTADQLRKEGNAIYMEIKFRDSLPCYTKSIIYASNPELHPSSKSLSFGYGNRSAALFYMKLYSRCLADIKRALPHYPVGHNNKLLLREVKCHLLMHNLNAAKETSQRVTSEYSGNTILINQIKELITVYENDSSRVDLTENKENDSSYRTVPRLTNANNHFPSVSDALEITFSDKGRGFKAKRDIVPGEVLLQEKAFAGVLNEDSLLTHCSCCMKKVQFNPVPCESCTSVIFCDEKCRDEAYTLFHAVECSMLPTLIALEVPMVPFIVFRILCQMDSTKLMQQFSIYEEKLQTNVDGFRLNPETIYNSDDIQSLFCLESHQDKRTADKFILPCVISLLILKLFASERKFDHVTEIENLDPLILSTEQLKLSALIVKLLLTASINSQSIEELSTLSSGHFPGNEEVIGVGIFLSSSLINHSCNPNMALVNYGIGIKGVSHQFIKAGTEVCQCYGPIFAAAPLTRVEILRDHYYFECNCEACVGNWPIYDNLPLVTYLKCPNCSASFNYFEPDAKCDNCKKSADDMHVLYDGKSTLLKFMLKETVQIQRNFANFRSKYIKNKKMEYDVKAIVELISFLNKYCVMPSSTLIDAEDHLVRRLQQCEYSCLF